MFLHFRWIAALPTVSLVLNSFVHYQGLIFIIPHRIHNSYRKRDYTLFLPKPSNYPPFLQNLINPRTALWRIHGIPRPGPTFPVTPVLYRNIATLVPISPRYRNLVCPQANVLWIWPGFGYLLKIGRSLYALPSTRSIFRICLLPVVNWCCSVIQRDGGVSYWMGSSQHHSCVATHWWLLPKRSSDSSSVMAELGKTLSTVFEKKRSLMLRLEHSILIKGKMLSDPFSRTPTQTILKVEYPKLQIRKVIIDNIMTSTLMKHNNQLLLKISWGKSPCKILKLPVVIVMRKTRMNRET